MKDGKYNGYENYPTWCVSLYLTNSEANMNESQELVEGLTDLEAMDRLSSWFEDIVNDFVDISDMNGMLTDLLMYSVDCVNWKQVLDAVKPEEV